MRNKLLQTRISEIGGWLTSNQAWVLHNLALNMPDGAVIVELGYWKGKSSAAIGLACAGRGKKVYCVDTFRGSESERESTHKEAAEKQDGVFPEFLRNMRSLGLLDKTIFPIRDDHRSACKTFDEKIDLLFIDADHTMDGVRSAYEGWKGDVKDDGVIVFHDYADEFPGTKSFVDSMRDEFVVMNFEMMACVFSKKVETSPTDPYQFARKYEREYKRKTSGHHTLYGRIKETEKRIRRPLKRAIRRLFAPKSA